jgi:hypothetical protein
MCRSVSSDAHSSRRPRAPATLILIARRPSLNPSPVSPPHAILALLSLPLLCLCSALPRHSTNVPCSRQAPPQGGPSSYPIVPLSRSCHEDNGCRAHTSSCAVRHLFTGCLTVDRVSPTTSDLDAAFARTALMPCTSPALEPPPSTTERHHR